MSHKEKAAPSDKIGAAFKYQPNSDFSTRFLPLFTLWRFAHGFLSHDNVVDAFVCHRKHWGLADE